MALEDMSGGFGAQEGIIAAVVLLAILVPQIISVVVYHRALSALPRQRRLMSPGSTYLLLIPFFGTAYEFYVVLRLSRSFEEHFAAEGIPREGGFGRGIGLAFCVCNACALIPVAGLLPAVAGFLLWLGYLLTVRELYGELLAIGR